MSDQEIFRSLPVLITEDVTSQIISYRTTLRQSLPALRRRFGVHQLWLYGPYLRGKGGPGIPLDILADIAGTLSYEDFLEMQSTISQLLGLTVELVLKGSMDPDIADIVIPEMIAIDNPDTPGTSV